MDTFTATEAATAGAQKKDTMAEPATHTLDVPGVVPTYDVRPNDSNIEPTCL